MRDAASLDHHREALITFVGLDLHKCYISACALDQDDTTLGEIRRMPVSLEYLRDLLGALGAPVSIGIEATLYWQLLHDRLEASGHTSHVADARQVKLIWQQDPRPTLSTHGSSPSCSG